MGQVFASVTTFWGACEPVHIASMNEFGNVTCFFFVFLLPVVQSICCKLLHIHRLELFASIRASCFQIKNTPSNSEICRLQKCCVCR